MYMGELPLTSLMEVWLITPPYERRWAPIRVGTVSRYKSKAAKLGPRKGLKSPPGEHLVKPNTSSVRDISRASEPMWSQSWLDTSTPSKLLLGARYSLSSTVLNQGKFIVFLLNYWQVIFVCTAAADVRSIFPVVHKPHRDYTKQCVEKKRPRLSEKQKGQKDDIQSTVDDH